MNKLVLAALAVLLSAGVANASPAAGAVIGTHSGGKVAPLAIGSGSVGLAFLGAVGFGAVATGCILTNSCDIWTGNFRTVEKKHSDFPEQSHKF